MAHDSGGSRSPDPMWSLKTHIVDRIEMVKHLLAANPNTKLRDYFYFRLSERIGGRECSGDEILEAITASILEYDDDLAAAKAIGPKDEKDAVQLLKAPTLLQLMASMKRFAIAFMRQRTVAKKIGRFFANVSYCLYQKEIQKRIQEAAKSRRTKNVRISSEKEPEAARTHVVKKLSPKEQRKRIHLVGQSAVA